MTDDNLLRELFIGGSLYRTRFTKKFDQRKKYVPRDPKKILCVIPGVIQDVRVRPGDTVAGGAPLCVLEAMKMQNDVLAPFDGKIKHVAVRQGDQVGKSDLLFEFE